MACRLRSTAPRTQLLESADDQRRAHQTLIGSIRGGCTLTGLRGDRYLDAIKEEMPGIGTKGWEFSLDGAEVTVRKGSSHEALLTYMTNAPAGETPLSSLRQELELKPEGFKSLKAALKDSDHPLTAQLKGIGVTLITSGYGRGCKSYLLKT